MKKLNKWIKKLKKFNKEKPKAVSSNAIKSKNGILLIESLDIAKDRRAHRGIVCCIRLKASVNLVDKE